MIDAVREWLDGEMELQIPFRIETFRTTKKRRLAQLVVVNGGVSVQGWGCHVYPGSCEENPWGIQGLSQEEAIELIAFGAMLDGIFLCGGATPEEIIEIVKAEVAAAWKEREAIAPEAAAPEGP